MTCHDAREQFSALVDEALGADARTALDAHLAGCAECRRELEAFRHTVALVRGIEPARAPAGFVDRVLAATRPEPWPRRLARRLFLPWPVKLPLEAAALIIVGVLAVWLFQRMPEQQQMVRTEAPPAGTFRQESPPQAPPARVPPTARETPPVRPMPPAAPETRPEPSPPTAARAQDVQAPRVPTASAPSPSAAQAPPGPPAPARRTFDKRESEDALKPAPPREEGRSQVAREGLRDQAAAPERRKEAQAPAAEAKRAQIQSATAERDMDAGSRQALGFSPSPAPSQVAGRLAASDHERAERDLQALVAKHGGTIVWRRGDGRVTLVDVEIRRDAYARFVADLGRLGRWTAEREAPELPETVRVQVQIE